MTRDEAGEREFSGFGAAKNNEYADCFIDADLIPEPTIKVGWFQCATFHPHFSFVEYLESCKLAVPGCPHHRDKSAGPSTVRSQQPVHEQSSSTQSCLYHSMACNGHVVSTSRIQNFT